MFGTLREFSELTVDRYASVVQLLCASIICFCCPDSDKRPSQLQHLRWDGLHVSKDSRGALGMDLCRPVRNTIASLVFWRHPELLQSVTHSH